MKRMLVLPALALAIVACREAPIPSEPETQPDEAPLFSVTASSLGYTAIDLGTLGGPWSSPVAINNAGQVIGYSNNGRRESVFIWEVEYGMRDLGTLGGQYAWVEALNDAGQVVGYSRTASNEMHAYMWDGTMHDLGTLGGPYPKSYAYAINSGGQVAGYAGTATGQHAFMWDGTMHDLGTLGGTSSRAFAINDAGQIVGWSATASGAMHAFMWDGTMHDLGTLGGNSSEAWGINNVGQVFGQSRTASGREHPFMWDGTMHDLGIAGYNGRGHDINHAGQVVGYTYSSSGLLAFRWDGITQDLGDLGGSSSIANAINSVGQVVGASATASGWGHAFVWDSENGILDLETGLQGGEALDINDAGLIVGTREVVGVRHAWLWRILTPVERLEECAAIAENLEAQGLLNKGQAHSFVNKINLATASLIDGKTTPAINKLEAFQHEASGYVNGGKLTPEQGDDLISCVQAVIDNL